MKSLLNFLGICFFVITFAQDGGGAYLVKPTECLSNTERAEIMQMLEFNRSALMQSGKLSVNKKLSHPLFIWPVKKSDTSPYQEIWSISNYVDHNAAYPNQLQDWNCGNRTYDTNDGYNHAGIDIFTWPFGWYQMDHSQATVIAAAPGIIIGKSNGNYDRNCAFNNSNWNAIYVQHNDGSVAWYGHMKNNSLTSKSVGDFVESGEFLGIVGSSGNSTGPHLHFEVYDNSNVLVDTYQGPCNNWTSSTDTWWQNQKNYNDPKINAVLTHSNEVKLDNGCGVQETTNFKDQFNSGEAVYVYTYLADIAVGTPVNIKLIRPNNTIAYNYSFNMATFYTASYWFWVFPSGYFNVNGNWKTSITIGSQIVTHDFVYGANMGVSDISKNKNLNVINPVQNSQIVINYQKNVLEEDQLYQWEIISLEGKLIQKGSTELKNGQNKIQIHAEKGVYLLQLKNGKFNQTFKIINE